MIDDDLDRVLDLSFRALPTTAVDAARPNVRLDPSQAAAMTGIQSWVQTQRYTTRVSAPYIVAGYAGTGKSTLLSAFSRVVNDAASGSLLRRSVAYCALTGKAANVLRSMIAPEHAASISTIHSLLYTPEYNESTGGIIGWQKKSKEQFPYDIIVVDEASMVSGDVFDDLQSMERPIIAVGDHGQLKPINGNFNLMERPTVVLQQIHRQGRNSPILELASYVRENGFLPASYENTPDVQIVSKKEIDLVLENIFSLPGVTPQDVGVLCHSNRMRVNLNKKVRRIWWNTFQPGAVVTEAPMAYDTIICLRNYGGVLFNGMRGYVSPMGSMEESNQFYVGAVHFPDEGFEVEGRFCRPQFRRPATFKNLVEYNDETGLLVTAWRQIGCLCDFGYALTVHKSQGSSFKYVILFDDAPLAMERDEYRRWLYTAVTRSSEKLIILR